MNSKYNQLKFVPISNDLSDVNRNGIYVIRNVITDKVYVGKTFNKFSTRIAQHSAALQNNKCVNSHLQNSYNKHGVESFIFYIQEYVNDINKLNEKEIYWVAYYRMILGKRNVYNYNDGGNGANWTQEAKDKLSNSLKLFYETHPEVKTIISKRLKKYFSNDSARKDLSKRMKNVWKQDNTDRIKHIKERLNTPESKERLSKNSKHNWQNEEYINKVTSKVKEARSTKQQRALTSKTTKERWQNKEYRNKMCKIQQERCKDKTYISKLSDSMKRANTVELRKVKSENAKRYYSNENNRKRIGEISKQNWKNETTRHKHKESMSQFSLKRKVLNNVIENSLFIFYLEYPELMYKGIRIKTKFFNIVCKYVSDNNIHEITHNNINDIISFYKSQNA